MGDASTVEPRAGGWLRRAGRLDLGGGESVLWSVAEGRRGRRWRSIRRDATERLVSDLLLELDPTGSWARLELATSRGILTLHPAPGGGAAHGNVVTATGVAPLTFAWSRAHRLVIVGEPVANAALGVAGAPDTPVGPGLIVGRDLSITVTDELQLPSAPPGALPGRSWPLEEVGGEPRP